MSRKNPHFIMGQVVQGTSDKGYSVEIKYYNSTADNVYQPDAQDMLTELDNDLDRLRRMINARTHRLSSKLATNNAS